jgi:hypothetical protein
VPSGISKTLTPEQRSIRARIAALSRWAAEDSKASAERGQKGLRDKFRREIAATFPDLPAAELERRAEAAYRAHMSRLAFASSKARGAAAA